MVYNSYWNEGIATRLAILQLDMISIIVSRATIKELVLHYEEYWWSWVEPVNLDHDKCSICLIIACFALGLQRSQIYDIDTYKATTQCFVSPIYSLSLFSSTYNICFQWVTIVWLLFCKSRHGVILVWLILIQASYHIILLRRAESILLLFASLHIWRFFLFRNQTLFMTLSLSRKDVSVKKCHKKCCIWRKMEKQLCTSFCTMIF